jgi:ATP-dependent DNA ligase
VLRLPEPMLARTGRIPTGSGWLFEPKLDGFRLLTCTHGGRFRARSREGVQVVATFEDGEALFDAVCERGMDGVVAKRLRAQYRPGERGWIKTKNKMTARFAEELAAGT